ncbi:hypothetical protein ACQEU3_44580 [Spirillospora sp. CA-253888]
MFLPAADALPAASLTADDQAGAHAAGGTVVPFSSGTALDASPDAYADPAVGVEEEGTGEKVGHASSVRVAVRTLPRSAA